MKKLKLDHELAELVRRGEKTSTWRIFDDKDISQGDVIILIDKIDPTNPRSWQEVGKYQVTKVIKKKLGDINESDFEGHEKFETPEEMIKTYRKYYGPSVTKYTEVKIIHFIKLTLSRHRIGRRSFP